VVLVEGESSGVFAAVFAVFAVAVVARRWRGVVGAVDRREPAA
jgi:hypothetical protein